MELRRFLWHSDDWELVLQRRARGILKGEVSEARGELACELAEIIKRVSSNRNLAMVLFAWAWKAGVRGDTLDKARQLCLELGDIERIAKLASVEYETTGAPELLVVKALALVDAGSLGAAGAALQAAQEAMPQDQSIALLWRASIGGNREAERTELELRAARGTSGERHALFLQLARLSRLQKEEEPYANFLQSAFDANPKGDRVFALLEKELIAKARWESLATLFRVRCAVLPDTERVEVYRRAGERLLAEGSRTAMAVRLTHQAMLDCYQSEQKSIPNHIAMLSLVVRHLRATRMTPQAIKLLVRAISHNADEDSVVWAARQGLALTGDDEALRRSSLFFRGALREKLEAHPALTAAPVARPQVAPAPEPAAEEPDAGPSSSPSEPLEPEPEDLDFELEEEPEIEDSGGNTPSLLSEPLEPEPKPAPEPEDLDFDLDAETAPAPVQESRARKPRGSSSTLPSQTREPAPEPEPQPGADMDFDFDLDIDDEEIEALDDDDLLFVSDEETDANAESELELSDVEREELAELSLDDVDVEIDVAEQGLQGVVEQRQAERHAVLADVQIAARARIRHDRGTHSAMTRDVSNTGMFLVCDASLSIGEELRIVVSLPGEDDWTIDEHELTGRVVREEQGVGYGIVFEDIPVAFLSSLQALDT